MKERLVVRLRRQAPSDGQRRQWLSRRASMRLDRFLMWFDWLQFESVPKFTLGLAAAFVFGISFGIFVTAAIVEHSSSPEPIGASVEIASGKQEIETAPSRPVQVEQVARTTPEPDKGASDPNIAATPTGPQSEGEGAPALSSSVAETERPAVALRESRGPSSGDAPSAPSVAPQSPPVVSERLPAQTAAPSVEPPKSAPLALADRPRKKPPYPKPEAKPEPPKATAPAVKETTAEPLAVAKLAPLPKPKPRKQTETAVAELEPTVETAETIPSAAVEVTPEKAVVEKPALQSDPSKPAPEITEPSREKTVVAKSAPSDKAPEEDPAPVADTATASKEPTVAVSPPPAEPTETSRAPAVAVGKAPSKTLQLESAPSVPTDTAPDDAMQQAAAPMRRDAVPAKPVAPPRSSESVVAAIPSDKAAEIVVEPTVAPSLLLPKSTSEGSTSDAVPPALWQEGGEIKPSLKDRRYKEDRVASLPLRSDMPWVRNAVKTPPLSGDAMIAIVIDDMGIAQERTRRAIELPSPLTMAFIPYGFNLRELTRGARQAGHEVMVHLPMEPLDPEINPGPNALFKGLPREEIERRIKWNLDRFDGYVGVNNHMGSKFTAWPAGMELVMREVQARGLLFLDSWTNNRSTGLNLAREHKIPNAIRDVFIDHDIARDAIHKRLGDLERIARRRGFAIGIGHPHELTRAILSKWIPAARRRGIDFVPISAIARRRMKSG